MYLTINDSNNSPLYLQIVSQIKEQVRQGKLKPGDELPSVRELAPVLGVNMHTVRSAYLKLREQGIINMRLGSRATIAKVPRLIDKSDAKAEVQSRLKETITDGLLSGLTPEDIRKIVDNELRQLNDESSRKGNI